MNHRIAVCPGTFDPITYGHHDIIKRGMVLADELIVAVAEHTGKRTLFNLEERIEMARNDCEAIAKSNPNFKSVTIKVESFSGLLMEYARSRKAKIVVRGLRAVSDFEKEFQMASANARLSPDVETVFLMAGERSQFISSQIVKEIASLGGNVSSFVSAAVVSALKGRLP